MKIRQLRFSHFGSFEQRTLDFPTGDRDLHIIYGANEAGKSTALVGLACFLFGFPTRVTHAFRYLPNQQRVAATLVDRDGTELVAVRRRGTKNTLREADDSTPIADDRLRGLLGGLDKIQYEMLFGIDHAQLIEGGATIASGQGSLGQMLFAAGAGLAGLRKTDERLETRLKNLFKRRGQDQPIAVALNQLKEERLRLKQQTIAVASYLERKESLEAASTEAARLDAERRQLRDADSRLKSYRAALPTLDTIATLEAKLGELRDAPRLSADFGEVHRATTADWIAAKVERDRHREDADKRQAALDAVTLEPHILAEDAAILEMKQALGAILKADDDRIPNFARMREHQGEARLLLQSCFRKADLADAESLRVTQAEQERIRELGETRVELSQAVRMGKQNLAKLDEQIAGLERQLTETAAPREVARLDELDRELLKEGALEKSFAAQTEELRKEMAIAEREVTKLEPFWNGSLQTVGKLNPPSADRIAWYEAALGRLDDEIREIDKGREQQAKAQRDCARQLGILERSGHVPDETELPAARAARDARINALALASPPATKEAEAARSEVSNCDVLSDRLRNEAERVAKAARWRADLRAADEEHAAAVAALDDRRRQRGEVFGRWVEEWKSAAVSPGEPSEMRTWLTRLASLCQRVERLTDLDRSVAQLSGTIDVHKAALRAALGGDDAESDVSLAKLHDRARRAIDAARDARAQRQEAEVKLRDARTQRDATAVQLAAAEKSLAEWRGTWGGAIAVLGLDADADPLTVDRTLRQLGEIFREIREAQTIERRLAGMDRDRRQFVTRLEGLRTRLDGQKASPLDPAKIEVAVDELVRRANDAKLRQRDREKIERDLAESRRALEEAEQNVIKGQARLRALCEQAGVGAIEELPELIGRSDLRRELEARLVEEQAKLRFHAGETDLTVFATEARAARPTLDSRLAEIQERQNAVEQAIPQCAVAASDARKQLDAWQQSSSAAADCQQSIESLLARLREDITEYAAVHLARQTLRLTLDRFRQRRHETLLTRAEDYFARLTRGAYRGLDIDESETGQPALVAVRAAPNERVEVGGLSDGTRDQLFLALRLAGIEQHIRSHGPMPVVVDDVLVNFDEDREAATLECLAELSKKTQVMVFTHHAHVVEMARKVAGAAVCCHDLSAGVVSAKSSLVQLKS